MTTSPRPHDGANRAPEAATAASTRTVDTDGASRVERRPARDDHAVQEALIGTDRSRRTPNISWGSIFAGVVTFLGLTVVLNIASAAMGLDGVSGVATGIWSLIALALALAVAGYVAGALAVRGGLLHGFLTWATSILAVLVLAGWLGGALLGAVGNLAGVVSSQVDVTAQQVEDAATQADQQVDQQQVEQQAAQTAEQASTAAWWTFGGALLGAVGAAAAGAAGSRSVINRETELTTADRR
ncbi:hypothetical protein [Propioniciclava soli]|uniref:Permease n=1 Tax=Propioniciclava soli TaxID=2775081 RepID=A0ABZ3CCV1_9ACTN|nr:hypothetical protein [Propioniciclava soli]